MPEDTKEQRKDYIAGLLREKQGVDAKVAGAKDVEDEEAFEHLKERAKSIDAELKRMGYEAKTPAKRAEKR